MEGLACQTCGASCDDLHPCPACGALYYCSTKHCQMGRKLGHGHEECSRMKQQLARAKEIYSWGLQWPFQTPHDCCSWLQQQQCHDRSLLQYCCPVHPVQRDDSTPQLLATQQHQQTQAADSYNGTQPAVHRPTYPGLPCDELQWRQAWAPLNPALIPPWHEAAGAVNCSSAEPEAGAAWSRHGVPPAAQQQRQILKVLSCHAATDNPQQPTHDRQERRLRSMGGPQMEADPLPAQMEADPLPAQKRHKLLHPVGWKEYYQMRGIPPESPAALALHVPLTLWYCLTHVLPSQGHQLPPRGSNITVAYLGPQAELCLLPVFLELLVQLPGYHISIHMIGPDVPQRLHGKACRTHGNVGSITINCWNGCWHDTLQDWQQQSNDASSLTAHTAGDGWFDALPLESQDFDLVFAANAGLPVFASWIPTLQQLQASSRHGIRHSDKAAAAAAAAAVASSAAAPQPPAAVASSLHSSSDKRSQGVPILFSEYCEEAAAKSQQMVQALLGQGFDLEAQLNPFRQPVPSYHHGTRLPACSNCFLFGWL